LPYDDEKGQQVTATTQLPDNNSDFYAAYYKNHRILQHSNLTGMISFRCNSSWTDLKKPTSSFFQWLYSNKIFLNQTRIKSATLVACGFLHGAHPGYLHRDKAKIELDQSLNSNHDTKIPFQLSARTVTVPIQDGEPERFAFYAVVLETSIEHATTLQECFYSLGDPDRVSKLHPYTRKYFFVPLLKSKEWPINKIWKIAKTHDSTIRNLRPLFLENLQDLKNPISPNASFCDAFMSMEHIDYDKKGEVMNRELLLHSIHNTGHSTTKVAIIPQQLYEAAMLHFSAIHSNLQQYVSTDYPSNVFVLGKKAGPCGQKSDSIPSCAYSAMADRLLSSFNPQDGEELTDFPYALPKRHHKLPITSSKAVSGSDALSSTPEA
jgi:hypothetical protein